MLAYANLSDLSLAKADGTESRKLVSVKGNVKHIVWSPDGGHLRFDTTESTGGLGQQLVWEVSVFGTDLHRLFEGLHDLQDACCGRWSADGNYFLFRSSGQIWLRDAGTRDVYALDWEAR
jgi:Tol biopolymer transport system component